MKKTARRAAEILDFPPNSLPGTSKCELFGSSEIVIAQCRGIIRYSSDEITVKVSDGRLKVMGSELVMQSCNNMTLRISGNIFSVTTSEGMNGG